MNNPTREEWHTAYLDELSELYFIAISVVKITYPTSKINDEVAFHNFSRLVYHTSSKYISPYTIANCKESLND